MMKSYRVQLLLGLLCLVSPSLCKGEVATDAVEPVPTSSEKSTHEGALSFSSAATQDDHGLKNNELVAVADADADPVSPLVLLNEKSVIQGDLQLIRLELSESVFTEEGDSYKGQVKGVFCNLDYSGQKEDPSREPFYVNIVRKAECGRTKNQLVLDLHDIVGKMKEYDNVNKDKEHRAHSVDPTAFIFHEGRCGSTLLSNSLMAIAPDKTKLYSEPRPPLQALLDCDKTRVNCNAPKAANVFRDTVYAMGRTNNPAEERLFFKLLPTSILALGIIKQAFPDTKWIFAYRDPVHVLVSNMKDPKLGARAPGPYCTAGMKKDMQVSEFLFDTVARTGRNVTDLTTEQFCAAYLATLTQAALEEAANDSKTASHYLVNYEDLQESLLNGQVIQDFLGLDFTSKEAARIEAQFGVYSKRMLRENAKEAKDDSAEKTESASSEILAAAEEFMQHSYSSLKFISKNGDDVGVSHETKKNSNFHRVLTANRYTSLSNKTSSRNGYNYDPISALRKLETIGCPPRADWDKFDLCCPNGREITPTYQYFLSTPALCYLYFGNAPTMSSFCASGSTMATSLTPFRRTTNKPCTFGISAQPICFFTAFEIDEANRILKIKDTSSEDGIPNLTPGDNSCVASSPEPSQAPSTEPSAEPSQAPSTEPSAEPSNVPSEKPSVDKCSAQSPASLTKCGGEKVVLHHRSLFFCDEQCFGEGTVWFKVGVGILGWKCGPCEGS